MDILIFGLCFAVIFGVAFLYDRIPWRNYWGEYYELKARERRIAELERELGLDPIARFPWETR